MQRRGNLLYLYVCVCVSVCVCQATRAYDIQNQRMASLLTDLSRAMGEMSDLRVRYEAASSSGSAAQQTAQALAQQVAGMSADIRAQEGRIASTAAQLSESIRANAELRGHIQVCLFVCLLHSRMSILQLRQTS